MGRKRGLHHARATLVVGCTKLSRSQPQVADNRQELLQGAMISDFELAQVSDAVCTSLHTFERQGFRALNITSTCRSAYLFIRLCAATWVLMIDLHSFPCDWEIEDSGWCRKSALAPPGPLVLWTACNLAVVLTLTFTRRRATSRSFLDLIGWFLYLVGR